MNRITKETRSLSLVRVVTKMLLSYKKAHKILSYNYVESSLLLFLTFIPLLGLTQVFHDNQGNAILFYKQETNIFYDYNGNSRFYLTKDNLGDINLYNFNGKHLGWYFNGTLRDHEGRIMASETNKLLNVIYKMPPTKPLEKITPLKAIAELGPIRPMWSNQFSNYSILFYDGGRNEKSQQALIYNSPNNYSKAQEFTPYQLPENEILEALKNLNQAYNLNQKRHSELLEAGYIFFEGNYYTKEKYDEIIAYRKSKAKDFNRLLTNLKSKGFLPKKTNCWIPAIIADEENKVLIKAIIKIENGKEITQVVWQNGSKKFKKNTTLILRAQKCALREESNTVSALLFGGNITIIKNSIWIFIEEDELYISQKKDALKTL